MSYQDFPPGLLTISPRLTRTGDPSASIQGVNTFQLGDGCWCYCIENKGQYQFDRQDNTTLPDGNTVIAPTAGPGRWFKRLPVVVPPPPPSLSVLVQAGFDQVVTGNVAGASAGFASLIRRDAAVPLQVILPNVVPGNILVVDASGLTFHIPNGNTTPHQIIAVVSFNGSTNYSPGQGFFWINNSLCNDNPDVGTNLGIPIGFRCYSAVVIPQGAIDAKVRLAYTSTGGFFVSGQDGFPNARSVNMSATELLANRVFQPGPGILVPY